MHAHAALRVLAAAGDLSDGHGGGVGAEDGIGLANLAQLLEGILLQAHDLGNSFDDEVSGGNAFQIHGGGDVGHDGVSSFLSGLALGNLLLQTSLDGVDTLIAEFLLNVTHDYLVAIGGGNLRNAGTHLAGAEDSNCFNSHYKDSFM